MKPLGKLLKELQDNYLKALPNKLTAIEKLASQSEWSLVKSEFHKLKGSGKTYGLEYITEVAQVAESIYGSGYQLEDVAFEAAKMIRDNNVDLELLKKLGQPQDNKQAA